jgi:hypothetical protein
LQNKVNTFIAAMYTPLLVAAVIAALCAPLAAFQPPGVTASCRTARRTTLLSGVKEKARAEAKKPLDDTSKVTLTDTAEGDGVLVQPEEAKRSDKVHAIAVQPHQSSPVPEYSSTTSTVL